MDNLNDSEIKENTRKKISPPKKNKKIKVAYEEFLKKLARPKKAEMISVDVKKEPEKNITKIINGIIGRESPFKPILEKNGKKSDANLPCSLLIYCRS